MADEPNPDGDPTVPRRGILGLLSGGVLGGLAGCGGDTSGDASPTEGDTRTTSETPTPTASPTPTETTSPTPSRERKIVFLTGPPSHGFALHSYEAGNELLADRLERNAEHVTTEVTGKWPDDPDATLGDADAVVMFMDGADNHVIDEHPEMFRTLVERGVGLAAIHWGVEVPRWQEEVVLDGLGGYFETYWSVNPIWTPTFDGLPTHPVAAGVEPFSIRDEWYYHMRFPEDMRGVTPILSDVPPDGTITDRWDPSQVSKKRRGNEVVYEAVVENAEPQHVAWAHEGEFGNRGFGFTGGHWHWNWGHDQFRTVVLNGIAWTAKADVPEGGITSETPTVDELLENLSEEPPPSFDREEIEAKIAAWNDD